jgi:hypothetical protein
MAKAVMEKTWTKEADERAKRAVAELLALKTKHPEFFATPMPKINDSKLLF